MTPATFGEARAGPCPRTYILLRAWCVWRMRQGNFLQVRAHRRMVAEAEVVALRTLVHGLGHGNSTGHAGADHMLNELVPEVLAP